MNRPLKNPNLARAALAMTLLIGTQSGVLHADSDHDQAKRLVEAGDILPLEVILQKVRERYEGRILEVELEEKKQQIRYEIELVDAQGVVRELTLDARTGLILKEEIEH